MTIEYEECLKKEKIRPFSRGRELASRELELAKEDFEAAGHYMWSREKYPY